MSSLWLISAKVEATPLCSALLSSPPLLPSLCLTPAQALPAVPCFSSPPAAPPTPPIIIAIMGLGIIMDAKSIGLAPGKESSLVAFECLQESGRAWQHSGHHACQAEAPQQRHTTRKARIQPGIAIPGSMPGIIMPSLVHGTRLRSAKKLTASDVTELQLGGICHFETSG